jgi:hypothetical protein
MGTTYYNTTGKPIALNYVVVTNTAGIYLQITISGVTVIGPIRDTLVGNNSVFAIVPIGAAYTPALSAGAVTSVLSNVELR